MNTESPTADVLQLDPPQRVAHPTMIQQWLDLSFVHWQFDRKLRGRNFLEGHPIGVENGHREQALPVRRWKE